MNMHHMAFLWSSGSLLRDSVHTIRRVEFVGVGGYGLLVYD
jgi:hypothetical protein